MTDEQKAEMERKGLEEQKMKEALAEKVPDWTIYCHMSAREEVMEADYWTRMIEDQFDKAAGDEADRWNFLQENFKPDKMLFGFEEFDGLNNSEAHYLVLMVSLPMLMRGHAIQTRILEDIVALRVPNLYKLTLSLPGNIRENSTTSFFDCKLRKLFVIAPI